MKKYSLLFIGFFTALMVSSQNAVKFKDSIAEITAQAPSDSSRASIYYNAGRYSIERFGDLELYEIYTDSSMYYSKISGYKDLKAKTHFAYGLLERLKGNYEVALQHLDTNLRYFNNDSLFKPYALFQVAVIQNEMGDNNSSLKTYLEILKIFEHKKDSFALASTLNSIAKVYGEANKYDEAIKNFEAAAIYFEHLKQQRDLSNTYKNIADVYLAKKDTLASRKYAEQALVVAREIKHKHAIAWALFTVGKTYFESDKAKTLGYYQQARPLAEEAGFTVLLLSIYSGLGKYYDAIGQRQNSINIYEKALKLAEDTKSLPDAKSISASLAKIHGKSQNFQLAYKHQQQYIDLNDSLNNIENLKTLNLLQKQFETEKKDKEITEQQLQLEQQENELQKKQNQTNIMTGIAIVLLISSLMGWFLYQQRQKRKNQEILTLKREQQVKTLESLMQGEEQERLRIARELHDGVNGGLSAIKYKLTAMVEHNTAVVNEVVEMLDRSSEQVRAISHNLVPPALEKFDLIDALEDYSSTMNDIHDPEISFQFLGEPLKLSKNNEVNLYRIVQELVSNAIKHAEATEITIQISNRDGNIQITVEDNGKGYDPKTVQGDGIGLRNIQSRIDYLKGQIDVVSNKEGTSCTIEIDLSTLNDH